MQENIGAAAILLDEAKAAITDPFFECSGCHSSLSSPDFTRRYCTPVASPRSPTHTARARIVDSKRCWYQGRPGRSKDLLLWARQSPPPVLTRPAPGDSPPPCTASPAAAADRDRRHNTEGGLDRVEPGADERGAADGRAPLVFARAAAIASQADTAAAVEVVDAALDHSSHRDRACGRRITISTSEELQETVDELAGTPGGPSRSNGGQSHTVVTPRVETSPDRSDFAKLGETKQFADDIRSQVAGDS